MRRRYVTVDVFTDRMFGGNQLAVVLDAEGLATAQMQSIAAEFGYAETTFVLPASEPAHTAQVRIFTPRSELPFAGHPNVGTACVLAWGMDADAPGRLVFEEGAGLVAMTLLRTGGDVTGAELTAPEPLSLGATVAPEAAAACLSLAVGQLRVGAALPRVASVGMPFLMVELADHAALAAARGDRAAHEATLLPVATKHIYAYVRTPAAAGGRLDVRMFAPLDGIMEDAATGSAAAAIAAYLLHLDGVDSLALDIHQGAAMARPSLLRARAERQGDRIIARVGGGCVKVMEGSLVLAGETGQ